MNKFLYEDKKVLKFLVTVGNEILNQFCGGLLIGPISFRRRIEQKVQSLTKVGRIRFTQLTLYQRERDDLQLKYLKQKGKSEKIKSLERIYYYF